jgi:type II secretory pathway predicted ATPase ExeA
MFGHSSVSSWFYDSDSQTEAVSRLLYVAESRAALGWLSGPDGSGRSSILVRLKAELDRTGVVVCSLSCGGLEPDDVLSCVAESLSASIHRRTRREMIGAVRDELLGRGQCGLQTVLLLDDLQRLAGDTASLLHTLLALNAQSKDSLTVIGASSQSLPASIADHALVHVVLKPLDRRETADFVRGVSQQLDLEPALWEESGLRAVHDMTAGSMARAAQVCRLLKIVHDANPGLKISGAVVYAVVQELLPRAAA